jgi:hypothetical protein
VISRREFVKGSSQVGVAIAATNAGLGTILSEPVGQYAAGGTGPPDSGRRAQGSFEIRCDAACTDTRREGPTLTTNGDEERYADTRWLFTVYLSRPEDQGASRRVASRMRNAKTERLRCQR